MKKFLALYMAPTASIDAMMQAGTPDQQKTGMDAWKTWMEMHKASFVEMGTPTGKNKRVTKEGVSDVRNEVCGYSFVTAASQEDAAKLFQDNPHLQMPGAYVEVLECLPIGGM